MIRAAAVLLLLVSAPGCYISHRNDGPPLRPDLAQFQVGVTTKAEVLARLGAPREVRRQFDGDLFVYRTRETDSSTLLLIPFFPLWSRTDGETREDIVTLLFDHDGRLAGSGRANGRAVER